MKKQITFLLLFFFFYSEMSSQIRPDKISGLSLWLRADSNITLNGTSVTSWNDCSGNGLSVNQSVEQNKPKLINNIIGIKNQSVVRFDGIDDYLDGGNICNVGSTGQTFFLVSQKSGTAGTLIAKSILAGSAIRWWLGYYDNSLNSVNNGAINGIPRITTAYEQITAIWNKTTFKNDLYANSTKLGSWSLSSGTSINTFNFLIGAFNNSTGGSTNPSTFLNGDIAEIIIYSTALSDENRIQVEAYLKNKYRKDLNLGDDISINYGFCDTVVHAGLGFLSYKWSTGETTEALSIHKSGTYWVKVTDFFGYTSTDTINVSFPQIDIKDTSFCVNSTVTINPNLTGSYSYKWSTGATTQTLTLSQPNSIQVTITDSKSCSIVKSINVSVDSFAVKASLGNDTVLCNGNSIGLINPIPLPNNIFYQWSDGSTLPLLSIQSSGSYSLTATSKNGCKATDTINITISGLAPIPDFIYSTKTIVGSTVSFNNNSSPSGMSWLWDFGDGQTSTLENPSHIYNAEGLYSIVFTVSNGACSNTLTKEIDISAINKLGLALWLRADSGLVVSNGKINEWKDISGNNMSVLQPLTASQPVKINSILQLNNKPIVRFDGVDDYFDGGTTFGNIPIIGATFFIVGKSNVSIGTYIAKSEANAASKRYAITQYDGNVNALFFENQTTDYTTFIPHTYGTYDFIQSIIDKPKGKLTLNVNGAKAITMGLSPTYNMNSTFNFLVGAYNNSTGGIPPVSNLNGDIAEIIMYNKALTDAEISQIKTYIINRYAPPVNLGPDITITNKLCDTIIHAGQGYSHYVWNTGDTTESIKVTKSGKYMVNVTDVFNNGSTDNINITFNVEPHLIPDTTICPKASLTWDTKLNTTDFSFKWSTGETTSSIIIKNAGDYILTVNDKYGCSYISDTVTVKIDDFDKSIDLGNDTTLCKNNELELVKGADRAVQYSWSDGTHNKTMILVSGDKYYYVTATDKYTCSANDSIKVKVQGIAPVTPFTMTGHCQNNEISLKDNSVLSDNTTKIIAYKWIIESDTLLSKDTTYTFKKAGLYYIKHIAITDGACSGSKTLPITIDPIPSISFIPKSVCQYSPVNFINTSSFNTSNSESIIWNIKGNKVEGKDTTTYKFNSYGLTDVSLTITTNDNCTDSLVEKVEVKFSPKAIFSNSPACELNDYFLFDNSTSPTAYGLTTRMWYINNLITQDQTVHLLPDSTQIGDNVLLKVTGVNGCFDTVSRFIPYSPIPKAALEFKKSCVGDITTFNDKSTVASGSIVKWKWNIGYDIESYEQNPSVIFTESKTYPITLHITSDKGCEDTIVSQTKVIKKPIAGFDYNPKIAGAPIDISFTNTSDSATSYKWTFGDSESSTLFEPIHEYSDSGKYTVGLYAYNNYMCVDSSKKTINLQKANYKIELYSITSTDKNGYVTVSTVFINAGLNPLTNIDFILTKDDGTNVKETWKGLNTTGVIDTFTFASKFKISNGTELPKYICIDAKVIGKQDSIVAANSKCITSLKEFTFLSAYPIPANDNLTFTFVSPEKGNAQYAIYSSIGQIIMENSVAIVEGINKLTIPTHTLIEGYYIWKLNVAGKEKTGKLLISRNSK